MKITFTISKKVELTELEIKYLLSLDSTGKSSTQVENQHQAVISNLLNEGLINESLDSSGDEKTVWLTIYGIQVVEQMKEFSNCIGNYSKDCPIQQKGVVPAPPAPPTTHTEFEDETWYEDEIWEWENDVKIRFPHTTEGGSANPTKRKSNPWYKNELRKWKIGYGKI